MHVKKGRVTAYASMETSSASEGGIHSFCVRELLTLGHTSHSVKGCDFSIFCVAVLLLLSMHEGTAVYSGIYSGTTG